MDRSPDIALSRRERQIMDVLFRRGRATAAEVMADLPSDAGYSTVRTQLRVLARRAARKSALRHLVETFFDGSPEKAVAALIGGEAARLTDEQFDRIAAILDKAR